MVQEWRIDMARVFATFSVGTGRGTVTDLDDGGEYRPRTHAQVDVLTINPPPKRRKRRTATASRAKRRRPSTKPVPVTKAARMDMPGLDDVPDPTDEIPPMTYRVVKRGHKKPTGARRLDMPKVPTE